MIKTVKDPDSLHWQLRDLDTGEIIPGVVYADDEAGFYRARQKTASGIPVTVVVTGANIRLEDRRTDVIAGAIESVKGTIQYLEDLTYYLELLQK